jgi:hypothetical protein
MQSWMLDTSLEGEEDMEKCLGAIGGRISSRKAKGTFTDVKSSRISTMFRFSLLAYEANRSAPAGPDISTSLLASSSFSLKKDSCSKALRRGTQAISTYSVKSSSIESSLGS